MRRSVRVPLEQLQPVLLDLAPPEGAVSVDPLQPPPRLDWPTIFGNDHPVELEIGCGKGLFLLTTALAHPDVNFVGVEIEKKYALYTATRMLKRQLRNVRIVHGDARDFLRDRVPDASLQAVHVYFPDPWWKKRHHKRRVFTEEFAHQCGRILKPGGRLNVVTDVEEYFQVITGLVAAIPVLRTLPPPAPTEAAHDFDYLTNFERKFRKAGKPIWRAAYERVEGLSGEEVAASPASGV